MTTFVSELEAVSADSRPPLPEQRRPAWRPAAVVVERRLFPTGTPSSDLPTAPTEAAMLFGPYRSRQLVVPVPSTT